MPTSASRVAPPQLLVSSHNSGMSIAGLMWCCRKVAPGSESNGHKRPRTEVRALSEVTASGSKRDAASPLAYDQEVAPQHTSRYNET